MTDPADTADATTAPGSTGSAAEQHTDAACTSCESMLAATVDNPFGPQTNVYRVGEKIFALINVDGGHTITLKTLPEEGVALRSQYESVGPGYHMNKRHWITIELTEPMAELDELIAESHRLVFESLPKKRQVELDEAG